MIYNEKLYTHVAIKYSKDEKPVKVIIFNLEEKGKNTYNAKNSYTVFVTKFKNTKEVFVGKLGKDTLLNYANGFDADNFIYVDSLWSMYLEIDYNFRKKDWINKND